MTGALYRRGKIGGYPVGKLYHGGSPDLRPGEHILPAAVTGVMTITRLILERDPHVHVPRAARGRLEQEPGQVFVGSRREAVKYAALWSVSPLNDDESGTVFEVLPPEGSPMLPDPGSLRSAGEAWTCERAQVVRAVAEGVTCETAIAMGIEPPGSMTAAGWHGIELFFRALGDARAQGRQLTLAEHVSVEATAAGRANAVPPDPRRLALRALGF